MKFGLGCSGEEDCLGGAACEEGVCYRAPSAGGPCERDSNWEGDAFCVDGTCRYPGFEWFDERGRCADDGSACYRRLSAKCASGADCLRADPRVDDSGPSGSNRLESPDGQPIEVSTHVINISDLTSQSEIIAAHGGGLHFAADVQARDVLSAILQRTVDFKSGVTCQ